MKVAFIIPYFDITAYGVRMLSSCLMDAGHERRMIFLPIGEERGGYVYPKEIAELLKPLVAGFDVIGFSLMTNHFSRIADLSSRLRKDNNAFFVWGGVHPTIAPETCFPYTNAVAYGEAEYTFLELLERLEKNLPLEDVSGFYISNNGEFRKGPSPRLIEDLDSLPFPDYSLQDDWALYDNDSTEFEKLSLDNIKKYFDKIYVSKIKPGTAYQTMTSRGCPYDCTYCCNYAFKNKVYGGKYQFRSRDFSSVVKEIREIMDKFSWIEFVGISDDAFFMNSTPRMKEFSELWNKEIKLKFFCLGSPVTVTKEKLDYLVDAGLIALQMGVQTGSERINELYNRSRIHRSKIIETAYVMNEFKDRLLPTYDIIINNPWENLQDKLDTLSLFRELPKPFRPNIFSLVLFPGTKLHSMAKEDKSIPLEFYEFYVGGYEHRPLDYVNFLWALHTRFLPEKLLSLVSSYPVAWFFTRPVIRNIFALSYNIGRKIFGLK
ncbi:MAG: B12-binding domain-containing radical SAM protein [Candidatus Coatesbacteria bacterium]|nr:B12-binding domain-containing radical SAM protein [Candidatus Coatesbacteria bacterium]